VQLEFSSRQIKGCQMQFVSQRRSMPFKITNDTNRFTMRKGKISPSRKCSARTRAHQSSLQQLSMSCRRTWRSRWC
jgi:hypothetical protein